MDHENADSGKILRRRFKQSKRCSQLSKALFEKFVFIHKNTLV